MHDTLVVLCFDLHRGHSEKCYEVQAPDNKRSRFAVPCRSRGIQHTASPNSRCVSCTARDLPSHLPWLATPLPRHESPTVQTIANKNQPFWQPATMCYQETGLTGAIAFADLLQHIQFLICPRQVCLFGSLNMDTCRSGQQGRDSTAALELLTQHMQPLHFDTSGQALRCLF